MLLSVMSRFCYFARCVEYVDLNAHLQSAFSLLAFSIIEAKHEAVPDAKYNDCPFLKSLRNLHSFLGPLGEI